jgi:hypothetical protein
MAYTLIGGTAGGTVLTLLFLPALYAIWFKVKPAKAEEAAARSTGVSLVPNPDIASMARM